MISVTSRLHYGVVVALMILLRAHSALQAEPIATEFVRALSSGDLRSFIPLAEDSRQMRERDWIAVARATDRFHCVNAKFIAVQSTQTSPDTIDYRIDLSTEESIPGTWYVSTRHGPGGWRIRPADDEAAHIAKRLLAAGGNLERETILENAESRFDLVVNAIANIPLYSADERRHAEPAVDFLTQLRIGQGHFEEAVEFGE